MLSIQLNCIPFYCINNYDYLQREQTLLFSNGILKMGGEKEPVPRAKKWPYGTFLAPDAKCVPGKAIKSEPTDYEDGDLDNTEVGSYMMIYCSCK